MKNIFFSLLGTLMASLLMISQLSAQEIDDSDLLNMSLEELMDIQVVNVSKINFDNLSEVPSAVTLITEEQITKSGAKNMEEIMRNVPGFDVVRTGYDPSTNFGVRGLYSTNGTNNKILFLIDDHPVRSVFYGDASVFIGNYPVENIKQIEIIRGPGSTLFGAGAFLAVINIRTKDSENLTSASAFGGSFGTYNVNAQVGRKFGEDLNVNLLVDYFTTAGQKRELKSDLSTEFQDPLAEAFGYTGGSSSAAPGYLNYGRTTSNINLNVDYKDFYLLTNYFNSDDETPIGPYESLIRNSNANNQAAYLELGYRGKTANQMGELLVKGYLDRYKYSSKNSIFSEEMGPLWNWYAELAYQFNPELEGMSPVLWGEGVAPARHMGGTNDVIGGEVNFAYNFDNYVNVLAGAMYEYISLNSTHTEANGGFLFSPITIEGRVYRPFEAFVGGMHDINAAYSWIREKNRDVYAGFGQIDFNLKNVFKIYSMDHFKVIAGARYDSYSDAGGSLNPRMALLLAPNKSFYFKGLYGKAFRAPSFVELYAQNDAFSSGNSALKPENVTTREVVAGYRIDKSFDVNVTYFNTKITNNIQLVPDADPASFMSVYTNAGDMQTSGIEAELRYEFREGAFVTSSFTVQDVLDVTEGDSIRAYDFVNDVAYVSEQEDFDPGRVPGFVFNLTGNYPVTKNINLNASLNYLGERNRPQAMMYELNDEFLPTGELVLADNRDPIEGRTIANVSVTFGNFSFAQGLSLQLTGYNLLDADNYNPTLQLRQTDLLRDGRHWGARLRYSF